MKTVDEVVSEWTEEEREKLNDVIEECRAREKRLIENAKISQKNLAELTQSLHSFFTASYEIKKKAEKLADDLFGIYLHSYNKKMPSS